MQDYAKKHGNKLTDVAEMLHEFEAHYEKDAKRNYSISQEDEENLNRILSSLKLKVWSCSASETAATFTQLAVFCE